MGCSLAFGCDLVAERIPACTALDRGMIYRVVPDVQLSDAVAGLVDRLTHGAPLALAATKRAVNASALAGLDVALAVELEGQSRLLATADFAAAVEVDRNYMITGRRGARAGQRAGTGAQTGEDVERWLDDAGVVALPSGVRVRGRRMGDTVTPADFALLLAEGPAPGWPHRRIRWPDFWIPTDGADALEALREAHRRAHQGERVEAACRGGLGRTGTALAALAVLDGLPPEQAVAWVRAHYHAHAVETLAQRRWLRRVG